VPVTSAQTTKKKKKTQTSGRTQFKGKTKPQPPGGKRQRVKETKRSRTPGDQKAGRRKKRSGIPVSIEKLGEEGGIFRQTSRGDVIASQEKETHFRIETEGGEGDRARRK